MISFDKMRQDAPISIIRETLGRFEALQETPIGIRLVKADELGDDGRTVIEGFMVVTNHGMYQYDNEGYGVKSMALYSLPE